MWLHSQFSLDLESIWIIPVAPEKKKYVKIFRIFFWQETKIRFFDTMFATVEFDSRQHMILVWINNIPKSFLVAKTVHWIY